MNLEGFNFMPQAQEAIDAGRDPAVVAQMQLKMQAEEAIKAGRDPKVVNQMLEEQLQNLRGPQLSAQATPVAPQQGPLVQNEALRGAIGQGVNTVAPGLGNVAQLAASMSPDQLKGLGQDVSTAAGGALLGASNVTHQIGEAGLDLLGQEDLSNQLTQRREQSTQQFKQLPMAQESPEAAELGMKVGEAALPTAAAFAVPMSAAVKGAGFVANGLNYVANLVKAGAVGAATGAIQSEGDAAQRAKAAVTEGLLFAGTQGFASALGRGVSALSNSTAMQRFWSKIPLIGNRGAMQGEGRQIKKTLMGILKKHDSVGNRPIKEVEEAAWKELTTGTRGVTGAPSSKVFTQHTNLYKKLLNSNLSENKSAAKFMQEYTTEINKLDDFVALKELRTAVSNAQFGTSGLAAGTKLQQEVKTSIRDLITSKMENIATKAGKGEYFKGANYLTQKRIIADEVEESLEKLAQKDSSLNDLQAIKSAVQSKLSFLKDSRKIKGPVAKQFEQDFNQVANKLGSNAVAVEALKNSNKLGTLTAILGAGATGGATLAFGATPAVAVGGAAGVTWLLSLMARKPNYMTAAAKVMDKGTLPFLTFIENILEVEGKMQNEEQELEQLRNKVRERESNGT